MKIGLLRHFKVDLKYPRKPLLSYEEVFAWYEKYNSADVIIKNVDLSRGKWDKCYASPLPRADVTSKTVYKKNIHDVRKNKQFIPRDKHTSKHKSYMYTFAKRMK